MSFSAWLAVVGFLLLLMALSSALLPRLPVSSSLIYLVCGIAIGPAGLRWLDIDLMEDGPWFERIAEIAVIVSLFVSGLKLRLPLNDPAWRAAFRLGGPLMLWSIAGTALVGHFAFGLSGALALLVGAALAPTDPVLAGSVKVSNAVDNDRLRYGLSGEAGLNDGAAFPFIVLSLLWMDHGSIGGWIWGWVLERLVWAVPAGLLLGYVSGYFAGRFAIFLTRRHPGVSAPNDFLTLAMIALVYVAAEAVHSWGFLAVFASGVGVRRAELQVVTANPRPQQAEAAEKQDPESGQLPADEVVSSVKSGEDTQNPAVAAGVVLRDITVFGESVERLLEVLLVGLVGIMIGSYWDWRAVPLAAVLFFVIRPLGAHLLLIGTPTSTGQRWLMGWFGIRGIGSLYYIGYALSHGVSSDVAAIAIGLTVSVVAMSIVLHGASSGPLLSRYQLSLDEGRAQEEPGK